jgi:hypothetical protein
MPTVISEFAGGTTANQSNIGDGKSAFKTVDHNGWIKLDGRLKSTLTIGQQAAASVITAEVGGGWVGLSIPDATGRAFVQGAVGAQIGSSTISQANLPNVNLNATSVSAGQPTGAVFTTVNAVYHSATGGGFNGGRIQLTDRSPSFVQTNPSELTVAASFAGSPMPPHSHTVPLGGLGSAYIPASLGCNQFVFLGA